MTNQIIVLLSAMVPTLEARYAILLGIFAYQLNPIETLIYALFGTFIATIITLAMLFYILPHIKIEIVQNTLNKIFEYTRKKHSKTIDKVANVGIISFIAVPLPGTGIYSGGIICYLLGFSYKRSLLLCTIGMTISALIILVPAVGVDAIISALT